MEVGGLLLFAVYDSCFNGIQRINDKDLMSLNMYEPTGNVTAVEAWGENAEIFYDYLK